MLAFKPKITVGPEGVMFRATAADGTVKFLATPDCLKAVAKAQDTIGEEKYEGVFTENRDALETIACKIFEEVRVDNERDTSIAIPITPEHVSAS